MPRKKKPTALHLIHGTYREDEHGPLGEETEFPARSQPEPPSWFEDEARAEWARVVPDLYTTGVLADIDRSHLIAYCLAWQTIIEAQKEIEEHGITIFGETGGSKKNPALTARGEAMAQLRTFGAEFGIGAASRARTRLSGTPSESDSKKAAARRLLKKP